VRTLSLIAPLLLHETIFCQSPSSEAGFAAADVHASAAGMAERGRIASGERVEFRSVTMLRLISEAYGVEQRKVVGGPKWLDTARFDVVAKAPAESSEMELRGMMRMLLADRFDLKVRREDRPFLVYVLTPADSGLQLKPANEAGTGDCKGETDNDFVVYTCSGVSMAVLSQKLEYLAPLYFDHPVLDRTGAAGTYDFMLRWTPRGNTASGGKALSLFEYLDKRFGIKATLEKVPLPVVVVESARESPTENTPGIGDALQLAPSKFEVAEVRHSNRDARSRSFSFNHGRLVISAVSLKTLIRIANDLDEDRVMGDKWLDTDLFDVVAKTSPSLSLEGMRPLLQKLLAERFKLTIHSEERTVQVYALLGGPQTKLAEGDPAARGGCRSVFTISLRTYTCENTALTEFVGQLRALAPAYITHPVVDSTELKGRYNFTLRWNPVDLVYGDSAANTPDSANAPAGVSAKASAPSGGVTIFEAIEKQLGLKLVRQKHSMPVLIVDNADRIPSSN
jgi:uncharacterized protein (TIGR03435 family)